MAARRFDVDGLRSRSRLGGCAAAPLLSCRSCVLVDEREEVEPVDMMVMKEIEDRGVKDRLG